MFRFNQPVPDDRYYGESYYTCICIVFIDPPLASIDDLKSDDFRSLLDLNVVGYFRVSKVR
jgi:hypothetical protein